MNNEGHNRDRAKTLRGKSPKPQSHKAFDKKERRVNWTDLVEDSRHNDLDELDEIR